MLPNTPDYKTITIKSTNKLGIRLRTTYKTPKTSFFDFNFFSSNYNQKTQKYPIVCSINHDSEAYKYGLRVGHTITKINNYSLEYKDIHTILSDFLYEKNHSKFINLTIY
tara:strand:+ start:2200 stop:2529 length:330 start_codon:yes stop_codon:yes gene_type:complete